MVDLFSVTSRDFENGRIFALKGELDISSCDGLAEQLQGPPGRVVVIDLSELSFIDSSGLGTLHAARRLAIKNGGTLVVSRPQCAVHRVLQLTGLDIWVLGWDQRWSE
jgi:anti-sigma B factor antagonist